MEITLPVMDISTPLGGMEMIMIWWMIMMNAMTEMMMQMRCYNQCDDFEFEYTHTHTNVYIYIYIPGDDDDDNNEPRASKTP